MKREFILEGLGCANCAAKMESRISQLALVARARIQFATSTLVIETEANADAGTILADATRIIQQIEPNVIVLEKSSSAVALSDTLQAGAAISRCPDGSCTLPGADIAGSTATTPASVKPPFGVWLRSALSSGLPWLIASALIALIPFVLTLPPDLERLLFLTAWLGAGGKVLIRALRNIARGEVFDENFLMALATVGAVAIGEYPEAVAVMLFYRTGELLEERALHKSRQSVQALLGIRPDYANLRTDDGIQRVSPEQVAPGSLIFVRPGERVPLDGVVREGSSALDTSAITGESAPRDIAPGDAVLSGTVNLDGLLTIETSRSYGESTVARILDLVENAASHKAKTEAFITRFARWYTPAVVGIAAALAFLVPLLVPGAVFSEWLYRGLIFLVVSCPCALVISIPLGYFGGIGGASRAGILVKGSNFLEALAKVDTVVFDKTGTLTRGAFTVKQVAASGSVTEAELLSYAALGECHSSHPIARAILAAANPPDASEVEAFTNLPGLGTRTRAKGREILAGSARLMAISGIDCPEAKAPGARVHVAIDGIYAGSILVADTLKPDAAAAVQGLRAAGVRRIAMLTGDHAAASREIAAAVGITDVHAGLLPQDKVTVFDALEREKSGRGHIVYVGDGINDAPVLTRADIGIAMGGLGSDAAIEAADIVIMTDEPAKVAGAIAIARRTHAIVWQNIVFALGIKLLVLALGAAGHATMWEAVFADIGVTLIAVFNAMRLLRSPV